MIALPLNAGYRLLAIRSAGYLTEDKAIAKSSQVWTKKSGQKLNEKCGITKDPRRMSYEYTPRVGAGLPIRMRA